MEKDNRPKRRETFTTGSGGGAHRRGEGLGTGPVGKSDGYSGRKESMSGSGRTGMNRAARSAGISLPVIIVIAVIYMFMNGGLGSLLGGGDTSTGSNYNTGTNNGNAGSNYNTGTNTGSTGNTGSAGTGISSLFGGDSSLGGFGDLFGSGGYSSGGSTNYSSGGSSTGNSTYGTWANSSYGTASQSTGSGSTVNTSVATAARDKYTTIKGNGADDVTIMVYLCGTDLESQSGMATSDLQEMVNANIADNVNIIVYTGGCKRWNNSIFSTSVNQIYRVKSGGLERLVENAGTDSMVQPGTLTSFIQYCAKNFPANRNELIFWDHGGGAVSGYGYDEKNARAGSMDLSEINTALRDGGVKFDIIGFDACLMATAENALMLSQYGDYLLASEEVEPGTGWYYTNWISSLSSNTSTPTVQIGKQIIDDYVSASTKAGQGQKLTLSITDLAELSATLPARLVDFSKSISSMVTGNQYTTVSNARNKTREYSQSSRIDQIDLAHFGLNMNNSEGKALAEAVMGAVKYNYAARAMSNSYGLAIYFPYQRATYVDTMCKTYDAIGIDSSYSDCIREFAGLQVSGQVSAGGASSPFGSLFGSFGSSSNGGSYGGSSFTGGTSSSSGGSADLISEMLSSFLGGNFSQVSGLDSSNTSFLFGRSMSTEDTVAYLSDNFFDASKLVWAEDADGTAKIILDEEQWDLVTGVDLNLFYDDGEGYIDLGLDNIYDFDDDGNLVADTGRTWLAIDGHTVAYYHLFTDDDGENYSIVGRVPAMLNGSRVNLVVIFDSENPRGYIAGADMDYDAEETLTLGKTLQQLQPGDKLDFLCDYYTYDGEYYDSFYLGEQMTVGEEITISNETVGDGDVLLTYVFRDIYNQEYWTESLER